jgi:hypothetical protein
MSNHSALDARERRMRSLDIIKVHNPTAEDFVFWDDKYGPTRQRIIVPKAQKDIGKGKGNNDIPRYLAQRFSKNMIEKLINKEAEKQTRERKKEIRQLPKAEQLQILKNEIVRTNDKKSWNELLPKVWLGVVEKYGGETIPEPADTMPTMTGNTIGDALENSGLVDKPYVESSNE